MQKFTMDSERPKRLDSVIGGDLWQFVNTMKLLHCDSVIANSEPIATRMSNNNECSPQSAPALDGNDRKLDGHTHLLQVMVVLALRPAGDTEGSVR